MPEPPHSPQKASIIAMWITTIARDHSGVSRFTSIDPRPRSRNGKHSLCRSMNERGRSMRPNEEGKRRSGSTPEVRRPSSTPATVLRRATVSAQNPS